MRAAFVAVADGKQVAVLCPTTLLAEQHYQNFADRFADWPVKVAEISRFKSKKEQDEAIALLSKGKIDILIFFWDPMEAQPHDSDVKALLRVAIAWNCVVACDPATADFVLSSPLMQTDYEAVIPDYSGYLTRQIEK